MGAAKRRVSSTSGGGSGGGGSIKRKATTATEAKSGRGSGLASAAAAAVLLSLGVAAALLSTSTHPFAVKISDSLSPVSTAAFELFYEASARAGPARKRAATALEALRDRWSEHARKAAAAAAASAPPAPLPAAAAVVSELSADELKAATAADASASAAAAAASAAAATAKVQVETPPTPTPTTSPPPATPKSTRPCSRSLSPTLVDYLLPPGPAWDGARAAVAAAFQGTRTSAGAAVSDADDDETSSSSPPSSSSSSPPSSSSSSLQQQTKATAVLLAAWSDEAREAAIGLIEAALPEECIHTHPSPMACYLRFKPDAATATAGDLQALLTSFLRACPGGIVTVPSAHELPPAATAVLINALSEGGGFEAADGTGHVPSGGALFIGTAAAPQALSPFTEDEVALVLGTKRALADGLTAKGTEAVAADALRRRWDVVAPVIEDEVETKAEE